MRLHLDRVAGRDRDHRYSRGYAIARAGKAKLKATQTSCRSNQKQLGYAMIMNADDNADTMQSTFDGPINYNGGGIYVATAPATGLPADVAEQQAKDQIKAGPFFRYDANPAAYHCPGDLR
jgi:hypothetical protein